MEEKKECGSNKKTARKRSDSHNSKDDYSGSAFSLEIGEKRKRNSFRKCESEIGPSKTTRYKYKGK
jgi:hypothetical protein